MPMLVWFTGLSGSGKSTISVAVREQLQSRGTPVAVLDSDVIRQSLSSDLGFSPADRAESLRRISALAKDLREGGQVVLVAAISPYREIRREIRSKHSQFLEVFVDAPLQTCEARDPKGLYKRARSGEIAEFTGVSAPYEMPEEPDLICKTDRETIEESCGKVLLALDAALRRPFDKIVVSRCPSHTFPAAGC